VALPNTSPDGLSLDSLHLRRALALAQGSVGLSEPNPRVGCVIARADGTVLGEGFTQRAGGPHAEIVALRDAEARQHDIRGATAYVTLEPCSHHGRTPPCCDALIAAGVQRVVAAVGDPNPLVAGAGLAALRAAGIDVAMGDAELAAASRELNIGFFSRMERGRPWVRVKVAGSLDGRSALDNGESQWITGASARADAQAWRRRAGAILTGIGTVLDDDPRLDVRGPDASLQPLRVVLDSRLRMPPAARILQPPGQVLIFTATSDAAKAASLHEWGSEVVRAAGADGEVDLAAVLDELSARQVNELHVEAGARLTGALLRADVVDEWLIYFAPKLLGSGRPLAAFGPLERLSLAPTLEFVSAELVGEDLRIVARPTRGAS
jgi:diaminohydroxyphosphoribosylaminopyrimidine deaminase/5-amino-6-(5-phosphoribosylamino)uracil reductase